MGGVGVQRHSFISLALGGGDWPPSRTGRFNPGKERECPFYTPEKKFLLLPAVATFIMQPAPAQVRLLFAFVSDSNWAVFEPQVQHVLKKGRLSRKIRRGEGSHFAACLCVKQLVS